MGRDRGGIEMVVMRGMGSVQTRPSGVDQVEVQINNFLAGPVPPHITRETSLLGIVTETPVKTRRQEPVPHRSSQLVLPVILRAWIAARSNRVANYMSSKYIYYFFDNH